MASMIETPLLRSEKQLARLRNNSHGELPPTLSKKTRRKANKIFVIDKLSDGMVSVPQPNIDKKGRRVVKASREEDFGSLLWRDTGKNKPEKQKLRPDT
ncbi:hypothetical protein J6590_019944 [Homalodisca vitripennis]|nr:hypothetical protein J6590_019944 [Homalodisca vitripennis]